MSFDPDRVIEVLNDEGVSYLVIGGIAAHVYGSQRPTYDLDIMPEPGIDNARRLERALARLEARFRGIPEGEHDIELDAGTLAEGANFMLTTSGGDLDVMPIVDGARPWDELSERAVEIPAGRADQRYRVTSRDDLIAMKRACGRRQDIEDIVQLTIGQYQARHARATVFLQGRLRPQVREEDATEAAELATLPYERDVRYWVDRDDDSAERRLKLEATLGGFTRAHATTWASVVAGKIQAAEVLDGEVEQSIQTTSD